MGVRVKLNSMNEIDEPTLVLATRKGKKLGSIPAYNIVFKDCLNSYSEISFRVSKNDNDNECLLWDELLDFKLLWCKEYDLWFEIYVEIDEANDLIKNVIGKSICEAELSQINLYNIEINTEDDIAREEYKKPTVFFDEEYPENSLLNRLMEKAPHYTITHVDRTLADIQKTFSFDDKSIYDAFQEIAEEVGCLFVFGSNSTSSGDIARTISVYDLQSYCHNCGHRGEFTDICPECDSTSISYGYGHDTGIFISSENLAENITYETDTDSVKNCFKLEAGDDLMNATIRNCNPNGTDYIWHISNSVKDDMSSSLVNRLEEYDELYEECQSNRRISLNSTAVSRYNTLVSKYNSYRADDEKLSRATTTVTGFPSLMTTYYDTIDLKLFLESGLMPSLDMEETSAQKQAALLTQSRLSPVAVTNISSLSKTVAENAVLGIAKIYINPSYTVKIKNSSLSGKRWTGNFTVTNLYDETEYATSNSITVTINDDIQTYLEQKISKALSNKDKDKYNITGLFSLDYDDFCDELERYSLNSLSSFYDACQAVLDILTEQSSMSDVSCSACGFSGQYKKSYDRQCPECGNSLNGVYTELYYPYWQKLKALQSELSDRELEIKYIENLQNYIVTARNNIQKELDFEDFMGRTLWKEFCAYRRESKFSNSNYISDGLNNVELFSRALEFIQAANLEIYKSSELQHSITSTLKNLLAIEEFQSLISNFEVGNWLRLKVDNEIYKLRLLEYEVDYDDLDNITVVFSDVIRVSGGYSDIESILKQASSMATSYDTIAHQASQGDKGNKRVSQWVEKGLALTNSFISNSDNQEVVLDSHGFTMKEYLPITDDYSDKQLKIINKGLYVTNDDWETSRAGIGNFVYYDPRDGRTKEAYGVIADTLIGNLILGESVGIYNKNNSITLDENGFSMEESHNNITTSFNINLDPLHPNEDFLSIRKETSSDIDIFRVDKSGNAYFYGDISGASGDFTGTLSIGEDTNGDPVFIVDENGNVIMNGGITLGGSISWGNNDSPEEIVTSAVNDLKFSLIRTLYYPKTQNQPSKPTKQYNGYNNTSASTWHKSFDNTKDRWLSRSFDGGQTWQNVEAITALTHIDATGIYTGTLAADNIVGGHISTATFTNSDTNNDYGYMDLYKQMIFFNENDSGNVKGSTKMAIGFLKGSQYNEPIIVMGAGDGNGSNVGYINKGSDHFSMYYKINDSNLSYIKMYNNNGKASIRINGIEFEQQDGDGVVYDFMKKADDWNNKLEAIKGSFKTSNKVIDGSGNPINISPENLGEMFTIEDSTIYLRPDVVLSWNAVYALYARTNLSKPTQSYSKYNATSTTSWHQTLDSGNDYYASYSYDGGKEWSDVVQIKGIDGTNGSKGEKGDKGDTGTFDYDSIYPLIEEAYGITSTTITGTSIKTSFIQSATLVSPDIYGEHLTLLTKNKNNSRIYNKMSLTPTSMSLINSYNGNESEKFYIDLGQDVANSTIKMRLGAGTDSVGAQALNIEKYSDEIRIGTYVNSSDSMLTDFAGMVIKPSTGEVTFTGTVQAVAVFG